MANKYLCYQLGFGFLNEENSDDFKGSSGKVVCNFNKS